MYRGGRRLNLSQCPFNPEHGPGDAAIIERPDGALGFKCQHNSCADKRWSDIRALVDGPRKSSGSGWHNANTQYKSIDDIKWPEIIPLSDQHNVKDREDYPLHLLPTALRTASAEAARFHAVPEESPAAVGISVLATAIGKKAIVEERRGLEHFPSLFLALIAVSGSRKGSPFKSMNYPLNAYAEEKQEEYERELLLAKSKNLAIDNKISSIKHSAKKHDWSIEKTTTEINKYEAQRIRFPASPTLFTTDATEQRLIQKMYERNGTFSVLSGEGRPAFDSILGKYSGNGHTGDAVYLSGISGDTITRDRVGADGIAEEKIIYHPCLNACLMIQPDKYLEVATHKTLRESGALARIWPVWLKPKFGTRLEQEDDEGLDIAAFTSFNKMVKEILDHKTKKDEKGRDKPHKVRLSPEATTLRRELHNEIETLQGEGGEYEDVRDIASKAVSQICKLAMVLHIAKDHTVLDKDESFIDPGTWAIAQALGFYHLKEAVRSQRKADEDPVVEHARRIINWILKEKKTQLSTSVIIQFGPRPRLKSSEADKVLSLLAEQGYLVELANLANLAKRKPVFIVNPDLFSQFSQFS